MTCRCIDQLQDVANRFAANPAEGTTLTLIMRDYILRGWRFGGTFAGGLILIGPLFDGSDREQVGAFAWESDSAAFSRVD